LPSPLLTEDTGTLNRPREQPVVLRHDIPHRLKDRVSAMDRPAIWKGLLAGFAGGLAASWAMGQTNGLLLKLMRNKPAQQQAEDSTEKTAKAVSRRLIGRELTPEQAKAAGPVVHFAFGSSVAAVYGAAAEYAPAVTRGFGLPFGAAVWLGAHVITVPALGLSPPVTQSTPSAEVAEFLAHLVYGGLTELIRSRLRRLPRG
jgi:putative membrane protein